MPVSVFTVNKELSSPTSSRARETRENVSHLRATSVRRLTRSRMPPKSKGKTKRTSKENPAPAAPTLVTPPLGPLCEDTREQLWSCISADFLALRATACLNREWRVAAVEHGSPLQLSSTNTRQEAIETLDSLATEFKNVMRLDARDSSLTDEDLRRLACWPSLTSLDAGGCQNMSSVGVKALVKGLGTRLKEFSQDSTPRHSLCKEMRVTVGTIKAIAAAPRLECLSLTMGSSVKGGLNNLHGHASLRKLSLRFEGFVPPSLPSAMPALEELEIRVGEWTCFYWPTSLSGSGTNIWSCWRLDYPKLKRLVVKDQAGNSLPSVEPLNESGARNLANCLKVRVEVRVAAQRSDIHAPFVVDPE